MPVGLTLVDPAKHTAAPANLSAKSLNPLEGVGRESSMPEKERTA